MTIYNRDERIDETLNCFKAYPPEGKHRHIFGKHELKDKDGQIIAVWVDVTEFRKVKSHHSVKTYTIVDGRLVFDDYRAKRWLSKNLGVC